MRMKVYTRPVSLMMTVEMYEQVKTITDQGNIAVSDYIREAIQEKLDHEAKTPIVK